MVAEGPTPSPRSPMAPGAGSQTDSRQSDSVGPYLQRLRVARGASLDDIARATRVGRRHLEALEGDESGELPAPVFVKGFIRAYCEFLETRPDEALERYRHQIGQPSMPARFGGAGRGRPSRLGSPIAVSLLLLVVLAGALLAVNLGLRSTGPKPGTAPTAASSPASAAVTSPAGAPPAAAAAPAPASSVSTSPATVEAAPAAPATGAGPALASGAPAAPAASPSASAPPPPGPPISAPQGSNDGGRQRLVVRALEATWVRVQIDRTTAVEELLPEGTVREWSAQRDFVITVGNAGGLELTLNGQRLPPLGNRGAVIRELVLPQQASAPRS